MLMGLLHQYARFSVYAEEIKRTQTKTTLFYYMLGSSKNAVRGNPSNT